MMRIGRTFGVACQTVAKWLKEKAGSFPDMPPVAEAQPDDVLELDELWAIVVLDTNYLSTLCHLQRLLENIRTSIWFVG
ncbi:MAG: hypothetical protein DWQ04_14985 [Chloroflexi bacterium]|nr:MAG: hypothetical protein DWQ04_14985 [Chloroflexota bacterium]